jgi:hypothetical protein
MDTLLRFLRILVSKITLIYLGLILVNAVAFFFGAPGTELDRMLSVVNDYAVLSFVPYLLLIYVVGIPYFSKCKKCGSRMQVQYQIENGRDASEPNKFEHYFNVKKCLSCSHKESIHVKKEITNNFRTW